MLKVKPQDFSCKPILFPITPPVNGPASSSIPETQSPGRPRTLPPVPAAGHPAAAAARQGFSDPKAHLTWSLPHGTASLADSTRPTCPVLGKTVLPRGDLPSHVVHTCATHHTAFAHHTCTRTHADTSPTITSQIHVHKLLTHHTCVHVGTQHVHACVPRSHTPRVSCSRLADFLGNRASPSPQGAT